MSSSRTRCCLLDIGFRIGCLAAGFTVIDDDSFFKLAKLTPNKLPPVPCRLYTLMFWVVPIALARSH